MTNKREVVKEIKETIKSSVLLHENYDVREFALDLLLIIEVLISQVDKTDGGKEQ